MQPFLCDATLNGLFRRRYKALAEVEFEVGVCSKVQKKSAPVKATTMPLVLTALQVTHKRGGKTNHVHSEHGSVCFL